tara:strand:+ start:673 stop:900 length:228 start_codon:yes stop_codon:yes gene_type:complete
LETDKLKSLNLNNPQNVNIINESPGKRDMVEIGEDGPATQRFSSGVSSMGPNAKSFATLINHNNYPVENFARIRL